MEITKKNSMYSCESYNDIEVCLSVADDHPFNQTHNFFNVLNEHTDAMQFKPIVECELRGKKCVRENMSYALRVFTIFLFSVLIVSFLHEFFHQFMLIVVNEQLSSFFIGLEGGYTSINTLPDVTKHSWVWWYFLFMGPLLVVNLGSIIFVRHFYAPLTQYDRLYRDINQLKNHNIPIFFRSIGYVSAIAILMNTIFYPLFFYLYNYYSIPFESDLVALWDTSNIMVDANMLTEALCLRFFGIATMLLCTIVAGFYVFEYGRRAVC